MKNWPKILASTTGLVAIASVLLIAALFYHEMPWWCVMVKDSPNGHDRAKLYRIQGFDAIFWIKVNGTTVYSSPDFAPRNDDFREQIAWDKSGKLWFSKWPAGGYLAIKPLKKES